jgi:hypothetical protein
VRTAACAAALAAALTVAACAGPTIDKGVFRAASGYQVTLPRDGWTVDRNSGADLELRHQSGSAAMLVNGLCDVPAVDRRPDVLVRQLLLGLRDRTVVEAAAEVPVNGRAATHTLMEGRMQKSDARMRIESYVVKSDRCVWDLLYVAEPSAFDATRGDFQALVESFVTD